jgi:hypothetical protein
MKQKNIDGGMGNLQLAGCDLEEKEMDQRRKGRSKLDCFFINSGFLMDEFIETT